MHGAHNRFVAIDHVVDQIARFFPHAAAHFKILRHILNECQIATTREASALAPQNRYFHGVIAAHIAPNLGQFSMPRMAGGGQLAVQCFHLNIEHTAAFATAGDMEGVVVSVIHSLHGLLAI